MDRKSQIGARARRHVAVGGAVATRPTVNFVGATSLNRSRSSRRSRSAHLPCGVSASRSAISSAPLFFRRPPDRDRFDTFQELPDLAVRAGRWKLLCEYDGSHAELYDLLADPGESNNLAATEPDVVSQLTRELLSWHASLPEDN
ncbi:MAG: hypothetical protein AAF961_01195, partial [Planctomycetota bacterium]